MEHGFDLLGMEPTREQSNTRRKHPWMEEGWGELDNAGWLPPCRQASSGIKMFGRDYCTVVV